MRAGPHPSLRAHVRGYTGSLELSSAPVRRREVPWAGVVLIVSFGPSFLIDGERHTSFTGGLSDTPVLTEYEGASHGVQVDFTPLGARRFLRLPLGELTNRVVALEDVLGPPGAELAERLATTPGWTARFALLDRVISARVGATPSPPPEVAWAWRRLVETEGRVAVAALADEVGWSRRHLSARFRDQVGLPPKTIGRILRFERVVRLLEHDDGRRLAEIAYDCGYADQAHLNRDFRELAGTTPRQHIARRLLDGFGTAYE